MSPWKLYGGLDYHVYYYTPNYLILGISVIWYLYVSILCCALIRYEMFLFNGLELLNRML